MAGLPLEVSTVTASLNVTVASTVWPGVHCPSLPEALSPGVPSTVGATACVCPELHGCAMVPERSTAMQSLFVDVLTLPTVLPTEHLLPVPVPPHLEDGGTSWISMAPLAPAPASSGTVNLPSRYTLEPVCWMKWR